MRVQIEGPVINYGEEGGLQNSRGCGASQVLSLQKKGGRSFFSHAKEGGPKSTPPLRNYNLQATNISGNRHINFKSGMQYFIILKRSLV